MPRSCDFPISSFLLLLALSLTTADILSATQPLKDGETIKSPGKVFELGFFSPGNSSNRYLGIWYHKISVQTVVWVANSDNPVTDLSGVFSIRSDGNLVVFDGEENTYWSSKVSMTSNNASAALLDTGNLELRDGNSGLVLWQSFDHPSNTLLPGMRIGLNTRTGESRMLRSWKNNNDPAPGIFSFGIDKRDSHQFFVWKGSAPYWRSGYWNVRTFNKIPDANHWFLFHFITRSIDDELSFQYSALYDHTRLVMDTSGQVRCQVWNHESNSWGLAWFQPKDRCSLYAACGAFATCNNQKTPPNCECMPGFEPVASPENWDSAKWSDGCVRKEQLRCGDEDRFVLMGRIKFPDGESMVIAASAEECRDQCVSNCSCRAYAYADVSNGVAPCLLWYGRLVDAWNLDEKGDQGGDLYIRVATSELSSGKRKRLRVILIVSFVSSVLLLATIICCLRMMVKKKGNQQNMVKMSIFSSRISAASAYDFLDPHNFGEDGIGNQHLPIFSFKSISMATTNFSQSNKLGKGGFGTVYKGTLPGGQEIAVKRLAYDSEQGLEEFKNEVILIAKFQHRNLVRLLGYCIEGDEKLLVYEYMPNKSLDFFLFDQNQSMLLDWGKRFNIILGIARGILYLHQDSRLRIVHRDLKASNILLDKDMNPKISDFGIARIFGRNQTQANTRRVIGTYGYMSPEYAIKGHFSTKSDVFSFGVILLEIVSGKKNTRFCEDEDSLSLLGHAWRLWNEDNGMNFMDPSLTESCNLQEVMNCIQVGLLCVQEDPKSRPTMASVVMFLSDSTRLPTPEQPPLYMSTSKPYHSSSNPNSFSMNEVTISLKRVSKRINFS